MDLVYISDFSLPIMRTLPAKLAEGNVQITVHSLDQLVHKHQNMPQQKCPLVSEGHHNHDSSHAEDHHEDDDHDDDEHSSHDIHKRSYKYDSHSDKLLIKDFQTEDLSYYTIGQKYPDSFANQGKGALSMI